MSDWVRKAVASAAGAVGFLGLVATTGGAIQWIKFHAAQLPANQAINVTPKHELVTIGAVNLISFAAAGVLAVLAVYALDREGQVSGHTKTGLIALGVAAAAYAATRAEQPWLEVTAAAVIAAFAPAVAILLSPFSVAQSGRLSVRWGRLILSAVLIGLLLGIALILIREWWFVVAVLIAIVIILLNLGVAQASGSKFSWYGAAIFISVGLFGFALSVLRTFHAPQVQAAIVLRTDSASRPVIGIYVTQTDDRIYLGGVDCRRSPAGRLEITPGSGRIYWLPLDKVSTVSIGPSEELDAASEGSGRMINELQQLGFQTTQAGSGADKPVAKKQARVKSRRHRQPGGTTATAAVQKAQVPPPGAICVPPKSAANKNARPTFDGTTVAGNQAFAAARRFRPLLLFDSQERWRPLNVPRFLAESFPSRPFGLDRHRLCAGESNLEASCRDIVGLANFEKLVAHPAHQEEQTFLDISGGASVNDYCAPDRCGEEPADCDSCGKSAIYYHVAEANSRLYIDYWWFLRFNQVEAKDAILGCFKSRTKTCFDHEGDWEGVTAITSARRPYRLEYMTFATHEKTIRLRRAQLRVEGERPVVYIARGTHAAYPKACSSSCRQSFRKVFPEGRHDGKAPWGRNANGACFDQAACLLPFPEDVRHVHSWNDWRGHWGSCGNSGLRCMLGRAPLSPRQQPRFKNPTCFDLGKRLLCDSPTPGTMATRHHARRARS